MLQPEPGYVVRHQHPEQRAVILDQARLGHPILIRLRRKPRVQLLFDCFPVIVFHRVHRMFPRKIHKISTINPKLTVEPDYARATPSRVPAKPALQAPPPCERSSGYHKSQQVNEVTTSICNILKTNDKTYSSCFAKGLHFGHLLFAA